MQHMFRTPEVEVYMGLIWLLWQKKWISHLFVKKSKNKFFLVSKGCFGCKMMRGIQKSWSQCSMMLNFWEIRSFLKKMAGWDLWQKTTKPSFQKSPNFAKSKRCRALGPTFLDSLHQFTSRTLIIDWKKIHFRFFHSKRTFLPLLSQQPWSILWFFAPTLKN